MPAKSACPCTWRVEHHQVPELSSKGRVCGILHKAVKRGGRGTQWLLRAQQSAEADVACNDPTPVTRSRSEGGLATRRGTQVEQPAPCSTELNGQPGNQLRRWILDTNQTLSDGLDKLCPLRPPRSRHPRVRYQFDCPPQDLGVRFLVREPHPNRRRILGSFHRQRRLFLSECGFPPFPDPIGVRVGEGGIGC